MDPVEKRVKFVDDDPPIAPPRSRKGSLVDSNLSLPQPPSQAELDMMVLPQEEQALLQEERVAVVTRPKLKGRVNKHKVQIHSSPTTGTAATTTPSIPSLAQKLMAKNGREKQ